MRSLLSIALADSTAHAAAFSADLLAVPPSTTAETTPIAGRPRLFVRLAAADADGVAWAARAGAEGVLLADVQSVAEIEHLSARLAVAEARAELDDGALRIIACVASGAGLLALPGLARASARVGALAWDAETLAADLGAQTSREADGGWIEPLAHARTRLLAAAAAAGLPAIDTPSNLDLAGFTAEAATARRHGFRAKFATSADQVAAIRSITNAARS